MLAGCSVSMPMGSLVPSDEDVTGSIPKSALANLDAEDWRRAKAALATALDPQGNGASVNWDNPASGARGSFVPAGKAYPTDAQICRAFLAGIGQAGNERAVRGTACADKHGEWTITELKS